MNADLKEAMDGALGDIMAAFGESCVITGKRLEEGETAARDAMLRCDCCLTGGSLAEPRSDSIGPTIEREFRVIIQRSTFKDHLSPQNGDTVTISGQPVMRVVSVTPSQISWTLVCRSSGGEP